MGELLKTKSKMGFHTFARLLSSFLFAFGTWRFVGHFQLLEFTWAPEFSGLVIFAAFWLFSEKYEAPLLALSLVLALLLSYKALNLKSHPATTQRPEDAVLDRLYVAATLIELDKLKTGKYPSETEAREVLKNLSSAENFEYCLSPCSREIPYVSSPFWLILINKKPRDKAKVVWYINDAFEVYSRTAPGESFDKLLPNATR